ncbi:purine permease 1-like isoform X2 [Iris pallida]|uniref:Probable purine permease n=1 Tax=Iris pallida TaxID=29817 RepID=A0AAX6E5E0_IRIPA|nr:purine permease 1-like isoform X2 [Iris pallida]
MEEAKNSSMNRIIKHSLMATNCFLLVLGNIGGPLVSRLYFVHGGRGLWLLSLLETAGFPILLLPLSLSYLRRRQLDPNARPLLLTLPVAVPCAFLGLVTGVVDFLYTYGLSFLPVSTSALLNSSQLGFTALFAFLIVGQRFTPFRLNAVALLTAGAVVLGMHAGGDRPAGESKGRYATGFMLTVGSARAERPRAAAGGADLREGEAGDHVHVGDGDAVRHGLLRHGVFFRGFACEQGVSGDSKGSQGLRAGGDQVLRRGSLLCHTLAVLLPRCRRRHLLRAHAAHRDHLLDVHTRDGLPRRRLVP